MADTYQFRTLANYIASLPQTMAPTTLLTASLEAVPAAYFVSVADGNVNYASAAQGELADSAVQSIVAGSAGVTVDNTDPNNPVISFAGAGAGDMTKAVYDPNGVEADAFARSNHTGTQLLSTISDAGTAASKNTGTAAGNVPLLDGSGQLDTAVLPSIAITDTFVVNSQAAMLALAAQKGDIAVRTDLNKSFSLATNSPSTLADWKELLTPTDAVLSVAGLTGTISAAALKSALAIAIADVASLQTTLDAKQPLDADLSSIAALSVAGNSGKALVVNTGGTGYELVTPAVGGLPGLVFLSAQTVTTAVAAVDFTAGLDSTYDEYELHLQNVVPVNDGASLTLRTSADGGATFAATSGNYFNSSINIASDASTVSGSSSKTSTSIVVPNGVGVGNDVNEVGVSGILRIIQPAAGVPAQFLYDLAFQNAAGEHGRANGAALRTAAAMVNALRFAFSSGNIRSGKFKLYGVRKS